MQPTPETAWRSDLDGLVAMFAALNGDANGKDQRLAECYAVLIRIAYGDGRTADRLDARNLLQRHGVTRPQEET